jgi:hypothetical protein
LKKLTDASNTATPEISTHSEAVALKWAEDAKHASEQHQQCLPLPLTVVETSHTLPPGVKRSRDVSEADLSYHSSSGEYDTDSLMAPKRPKSMFVYKYLSVYVTQPHFVQRRSLKMQQPLLPSRPNQTWNTLALAALQCLPLQRHQRRKTKVWFQTSLH